MIHLDTNILIGSVTSPSPYEAQILAWLSSGEAFAVSAVAWSEFMNGPVSLRDVESARALLEGRVVPFGVDEAELASRLFNKTGRRRGTQSDCFIAATAICASASLATRNQKHFLPLVSEGLKLA